MIGSLIADFLSTMRSWLSHMGSQWVRSDPFPLDLYWSMLLLNQPVNSSRWTWGPAGFF